MPKALTIYVEQYSFFWKLTPQEWRKILEGGIRGEGHMLPDEKMLKRRPGHCIGRVGSDDDISYYSLKPDTVLLYAPLDWEPEAYQDALDELEEKEKK